MLPYLKQIQLAEQSHCLLLLMKWAQTQESLCIFDLVYNVHVYSKFCVASG